MKEAGKWVKNNCKCEALNFTLRFFSILFIEVYIKQKIIKKNTITCQELQRKDLV